MQTADGNVLSVMSLGCDRRFCTFSLLVLILGLLSTELDMFVDHVQEHAEHYRCPLGHFGPQHVVPGDCGTNAPPCNACLFHKLLAHSLVPYQPLFARPTEGVAASDLQLLHLAGSFLRREKSRSPPLC